MNRQFIEGKILNLFRKKDLMSDVGLEQDFFDLGVSSLTIVELQIVIEKELDVQVSTSDLMISPTIMQWVEVYAEKAREQGLLELDSTVV